MSGRMCPPSVDIEPWAIELREDEKSFAIIAAILFVDAHCHLHAQYFPNADDAIARANTAGVTGFIVVGGGPDMAPLEETLALAKRRPQDVGAVLGVHPHDAAQCGDEMFAKIREMVRDEAVVAVGEIGLDYHYDHSPRDVQREMFARFIAVAREVKKPIVIHTRSAGQETLDILEAEGAKDVGGIIHCFSEDVAFARRALDLDFDVSFAGIVTFKTAVTIKEAAAFVPEDRFHVETDSPYLAPVPLRGKPCEPAYVVHTAKVLAELRKTSLSHIAEMTHRNTERRFRRTFPSAATSNA